ncbi:4a-hydroxytetrahydrobiopterin dehydratase [soil metagenome]
MAHLTDEQLAAFLAEHGEWQNSDQSMVRSFEFADFVAAMGFVTSVAMLAEKAFHHPDIDIRWNTVTLRLSTHSEGGLTKKDTDLAIQIDNLV